MFADFLQRLIQPEPKRLSGADSHLALAALLVRVARADGHYDPSEATRIETVLRTRYDIDEAGARQLRGEAEVLESEAPDTVRFTKAIKDAVPYEDRISVIEGLWSIVLADGQRDHQEDTILRLVSNLLGVSDRDSALARQRMARQVS
ncbi:tellurite resistance TerB family protein [Pacificibacter marinus]|uniref:Tellurite resistance protein TerB n=1 Tax=Pacificibacter marinus TaxID=658057 RepID=A0A1Y5SQJ7_9RHOB|nr:TerB family tellurite resistance protein [Pacificibacter marinus]SEK67866.1 Uncharacterized conserved protein, tellurite resistance protein B (TerB) family [Pacificibacter marinus]SLN46138.1 Tellurite resistance protein TerB [Pacificibacter marinus]